MRYSLPSHIGRRCEPTTAPIAVLKSPFKQPCVSCVVNVRPYLRLLMTLPLFSLDRRASRCNNQAVSDDRSWT